MKNKCIFTIVLLLALAATASAQTPWRTIDSLMQSRAYSDAYELAQQNYSHALEQGDSYNLLRAACSMSDAGRKLYLELNEESLLRQTLPHLAPLERALCHTMLANIYANTYDGFNRSSDLALELKEELQAVDDATDTVFRNWSRARLADSIARHTVAALANRPLLRSRRVADYNYIASHDTLSDYSSLTLYEAVAYAAVHNVVNDSLLFTKANGLGYSDSLFRAMCNPFALADRHLPQGSSTLWKLGLLQEVSRFLIGNAPNGKPDTTSVSWQLLCRELDLFLTHFSPAWQYTFDRPRITPAGKVEISSIVAPDDGCFFTYAGDTTAMLYLRILSSIESIIDTMANNQRLRYALSQPMLHSLTVQLMSKKHRYSLPALPVGKYTLLVSDTPFPTSLDIPDSCLPPVNRLSFACQSAVIETVSGAQGFVLDSYSGQPLADIPVTLRGKVSHKGDWNYDSITLMTHTDSMGRYNFRPQLPNSGILSPVISVTHQGHTYSHVHGGNDFGEYQYYPSRKKDADTLLSFLLSAPIYRYEDTVRFTVMAHKWQHSNGRRILAAPLPHCDISLQLKESMSDDYLTSIKLTTDDMGWAEGEIILSQVLDKETEYDELVLGVWKNDNIEGIARFAVDNYTLPTLTLLLHSLADTHRYGMAVDIAGRLSSRSGAAVVPTSVSYTLFQDFEFAPWTKGVGNEHSGDVFVFDYGELPIQPDGSFNYAFTPFKYEDLPYRNGEFAQYRLEVTATDPTGGEVTESIVIAVGDYTGSLNLSAYRSKDMTSYTSYNRTYIDGLEDIQAICNNLDEAPPIPLAVPARLAIETDEANATLVWQGEVQLPDKSTPLSKLIPAIELPDGHLRFVLSSPNPRLHPDSLRVAHLGPDAAAPLDSTVLYASAEKNEYLVGDTLRVRVGSAKQVSALLIISHGDSLQLLRRLNLDKGFAHIAIPITEELTGTIGISVLAYHKGERFSGSYEVWAKKPLPSLRLQWLEPEGFNLTPASPDFHLQRLFAGTSTHWRLRITDSLDNPVQAALALTSYDNAITLLPDIYGQPFFSISNQFFEYYEFNNSYCSFRRQYNHKHWMMRPHTGQKAVQKPFFGLRPFGISRELSFQDLPRLNTLLSVGTSGYDVLYYAMESEEYDDNPWRKLDNMALPSGMLRTELSPYGPWLGNLHSDRDGIVDLHFNAPQRLARWQLDGVAMDKQGTIRTLYNSYLTYRDIMLQPNVPTFLYTGDSTAFSVRIDRMDSSAAERVAVRYFGSKKLKGRYTEAVSSPASPMVQFPLIAPRALRPFAPRQVEYAFTASNPLHKDIVLDAQAGSIPLLPKPKLKGNAYPLTQADYRTLQTRSKRFFRWWKYKDYNIGDLFDSLYIAAAFHNNSAVDTLLQMIDKAQLPGGGWPSEVGEKRLYSESASLHYLTIIRRLQQECPHVKIPASFNIKRTLQQADSLVYAYWSKYPQTVMYNNRWLTIHHYFSQYPLDTAYYLMRDSLYAVLKRNNPDSWDILTIYRQGDTALALQLAQNIVQASVFDTLHPERGRHWLFTDHSPDCLLNYIEVFEEVLHDTLLANQVRQRIRYLAPTLNTGNARLAALGYLNHPEYATDRREANITLSRQLIPTKNNEASPHGHYTIRLTITLDRPMSHLYLRSPHAACFSSHGEARLISSTAGRTDYISLKELDAQIGSVATQFAGPSNCLDIYIKLLPAGTHTVEYTVTADRSGSFLLPAATVQCMATPWGEAKKGVLQAAAPAETITR